MKNIFITGGAGYIGSHMVKYFLNKRFNIIVFDNLSFGHKELVDENAIFEKGDLCSTSDLNRVFRKYSFDVVMHCAALSNVCKSVEAPLEYYKNNVIGTINLLETMLKFGVKKIIFSSSASVYGKSTSRLIKENCNLQPTNPYGASKMMVEKILNDFDTAYGLRYVSLRYFNAAGAAYNIGEWHEPETHLIPLVINAATGNKPIKIYGTDYKTKDGTCIRDYIHVIDLVSAHSLALEFLFEKNESRIYNLGSGTGYSVREIIDRCKEIGGIDFNVKECDRRIGDPPILIADSTKITNELGWKRKYGLNDMVQSAFEWHQSLFR